jgi:hypothetical protein
MRTLFFILGWLQGSHAFSASVYRMVQREWRPPGDFPRGVGMMKPNILITGSSKGLVYFVKNGETMAAFPLAPPKTTLQSLQVVRSRLLLDARDRTNGDQVTSVFDLAPTHSSHLHSPILLGVHRWTNMTMFHGMVGTTYVRISSNHWMFMSDGNNNTASRLDFDRDAMIVTACEYGQFLFVLLKDWKLHIFMMKGSRVAEKAHVPIPHLSGDIPTSISISHTSTPSLCQVAIGSNRLTIFELGLVFSGKNNISEWNEISMPRRLNKICFVNPDALVLIDEKNRLELYQWKIRSPLFIATFQHEYHTRIHPMHPFLALDGDREIIYWESVKIKHPLRKHD